ncbi:hypothetical protein [Borrelia persica]|uniref:hypothetical protein n=1 Tax=Borrelia persica TaxID=44448 RepID=UPI000465F66E|nr:hypothetical protein [Borrelia persica]
MKICKIFISLLTILSFSCNLAEFFDKDFKGEDGKGRDVLSTIIEGSERFLDSLLEGDVEYEYYYVDEEGNYFDEHDNAVILNEDGTFVYKDKNIVVDAEGKSKVLKDDDKLDVSAGEKGSVSELVGKLSSGVKEKVFGNADKGQEALVPQVSQVAAKGSDLKSMVAKVEGDVKGSIRQVVAAPVLKAKKPASVAPRRAYNNTYNNTPQKLVRTHCKFYDLRPGERASKLYISEDERKMFNFLEKHIKDTIDFAKNLPNHDEIKRRYEKLMTKAKEDTLAGEYRVLDLGRATKKLYDYVKSNASNSAEIKKLIELGLADQNSVLYKSNIKSVSDIKNYDDISVIINFALTDKGNSNSIRTFFEALAGNMRYVYTSDEVEFLQELVWKIDSKFQNNDPAFIKLKEELR